MGFLRVTNIQRMCFHDGPGIRTMVFLKGCSLHCPWCSNPENITFEKEGIFGIDYTAEQLYQELIKDRVFWEEKDERGRPGGITFSGGEPFLQAEEVLELVKKLKSRGIDIAIETALFVQQGNIQKIIDYIDYVIADVKILQRDECKGVLGGDPDIFLENVNWLYEHEKIDLFRIPCCREYTLTAQNKHLLLDFLLKYRDVPIQIFELHQLAQSKYEMMGKRMWRPDPMKNGELDMFLKELTDNGLKAERINI